MTASPLLDRESAPVVGNSTYPQPLRLDVERYRVHLKGLDLTEEQATEVLQTLWSILETFVDEAFGVDSFTLARPQPEVATPPAEAAAVDKPPAL
jgi:hypothetical protein